MMRRSPRDVRMTTPCGTPAETVAVLQAGARLGVDTGAPARHLAFLDLTELRHTVRVAPAMTEAPQHSAGCVRGRKRENGRRVHFVSCDLCGATMPDGLDVHGLVWTSSGKAHIDFGVDGVPIEPFCPLQLGLARKFDGNETVTDPSCALPVVGHVGKFAAHTNFYLYVHGDHLALRVRLIEG